MDDIIKPGDPGEGSWPLVKVDVIVLEYTDGALYWKLLQANAARLAAADPEEIKRIQKEIRQQHKRRPLGSIPA